MQSSNVHTNCMKRLHDGCRRWNDFECSAHGSEDTWFRRSSAQVIMPSPQSGHPSKRRKLNSSQSQSVKYSDSTKTEIADSLHSSGKRKRKLPSFAARPGSKSTDSINPTNPNQTRVPRRNKRRTASTSPASIVRFLYCLRRWTLTGSILKVIVLTVFFCRVI